ncbi:MAG: LysR family transcriptional regulator [Acidobacteriota bacterium]
MDMHELQVFLSVAAERSFSKAAAKLHRTQAAVSQAIRRLEEDLGERLIDRGTRDGRLTEAGLVLRDHAERLMRLAEETRSAVREVHDLRRGRVLVGANEGTVHGLLPIVVRFKQRYPDIHIDVRRVPARQIAAEVEQGSLDLGILTFHPASRGVATLALGLDDLVLLVPPDHPFARRRVVHMAEVGRQPIVAHNDPSPARERVLRTYERRHEELNIQVSLPSLDAVKRAVGMGLGVAILPKRCALAELAHGELAAIRIPEVRMRRQLRLVYRRTGERSRAAEEFMAIAQEYALRPPSADSSRPRTP